MSTTRPHEFDVAVIGGGPAGATTACRLARAGRRVMLLERDRFPRFHIGESLLATVNEVLEEIGAADLVAPEGFPPSGARRSSPATERSSASPTSRRLRGAAPQTWQVPRAEFDELLLRHAAASGADVREGHRVLDVAFDGDGATVAFRDAADCPREVRVAAVVDASGRVGLLARKLDLREDEPGLDNIAVFAHYSGVPRAEGRRAGDIRIVARDDLGWFWLIPISEELMSVGVVLPRAAYDALPRIDPEALLEHTIRETPGVARLMRAARREWPVRVEKDFSFGSRAYAGDRLVLVGDAGSFLDPVFSTGVAIALESGVEAARALDAALPSGDLSARAFARLRSPTAAALPIVPALRPRLLHAGIPRVVLRDRPAEPHVPRPDHLVRRLLASIDRHPRLAGDLLRAGMAAQSCPRRVESRGDRRRPVVEAERR